MRRVFIWAGGAALAGLMAGCGGSKALGIDSDVVVRLLRTDGTQDMRNYEVYITKNGATTFSTGNHESFASTSNRPTWCDGWSANATNTELTLNFRTRSTQTPYYVWVKVPNTASRFETLELRINVDRTNGPSRRYDLNINQTTRLPSVRIERNSASY